MKCKVKDCNIRNYAKGYCRKHYRQFTKYGRVKRSREQERKRSLRFCIVEGCDGVHRAKGYCHKHYCQFRIHGTIVQNKGVDMKQFTDDEMDLMQRLTRNAVPLWSNLIGEETENPGSVNYISGNCIRYVIRSMFQYKGKEILGFNSIFHVEIMQLILEKLTSKQIYNSLYGYEIEAFQGEALEGTLQPDEEELDALKNAVKNLIEKLKNVQKETYKNTERNLDELFCWGCGEEEDLVLISNDNCTVVNKGRHACRNCCIECTFLPDCSYRSSEWYKSVEIDWTKAMKKKFKEE